jgi:Putative peptidoglycan binding domain
VKNKRLILVSCWAAAAFIASPTFAAMQKKTGRISASKPQRMATRTVHVTPNAGHVTRQMTVPAHNPNTASRVAGMRQQIGTSYYGGNRYTGTRYYGNNGYYVGYPYGTSSVWPYVASSFWGPGYNYYPYSYYGGYPYSYSSYGDYPYSYSYYHGYGYGGSTVAAVQRRLGELGYYLGVVDGVIGPRTRAAISAFESRHGLVVDGTISRPLLNRLGLT